MADEKLTTAERDHSIITEHAENQEDPRRVRSAVKFGLRAAALAGLVLSAGAVTGAAATGLTSVFDDDSIAVVAGPTCCWPDKEVSGD